METQTKQRRIVPASELAEYISEVAEQVGFEFETEKDKGIRFENPRYHRWKMTASLPAITYDERTLESLDSYHESLYGHRVRFVPTELEIETESLLEGKGWKDEDPNPNREFSRKQTLITPRYEIGFHAGWHMVKHDFNRCNYKGSPAYVQIFRAKEILIENLPELFSLALDPYEWAEEHFQEQPDLVSEIERLNQTKPDLEKFVSEANYDGRQEA